MPPLARRNLFHDKIRLLVEQPAPDQLDKAQAAVRRCPKRALSLVEE